MIGKLFFILSISLASYTSWAQRSSATTDEPLPTELKELITELQDSQLSTYKQLRKLFFHVKRNYLVKHQLSSTYTSTLQGRTYDCVTGTLLYDNLLKSMGFQTTIHEFNHHVLLAVHTGTQDILFDCTDPYGIIKGRKEVAATIAFYKKQKKVLPDTNIYETIGTDEALGLYYFNQSVRHLDTEDIDGAKEYAALALKQYPCDRTLALRDLLSHSHQQIMSVYSGK